LNNNESIKITILDFTSHEEQFLIQIILKQYCLRKADVHHRINPCIVNKKILSLSVLTAIFQVNLGVPVFIEARNDGGGEW